MKDVNFLVAGVGGQGTLLASDMIAEVGMAVGQDVKKSEVHGMAQRGGAVVSHVRWGQAVASPLCERGKVDYFVAQEQLEALRWMDFIAPHGIVFFNDQRIPPTSTVFGDDVYPGEAEILKALREAAGEVRLVRAARLAEELGNPRVANTVLLGALSACLQVPQETWLEVVSKLVPPRHVEINRRAFLVGRGGRG